MTVNWATEISGNITGEHFQKQAADINDMGVEIGKLKTILRENNITVE